MSARKVKTWLTQEEDLSFIQGILSGETPDILAKGAQPMLLRYELKGELTNWLIDRAAEYATSPEDICEGCIQFMRYLIESRPSQDCRNFREELLNRSTRVNKLAYRCQVAAAECYQSQEQVTGLITQLALIVPDLIPKEPIHQDPDIEEDIEEPITTPTMEEEDALESEIAVFRQLVTEVGIEEHEQFMEAELVTYLFQTAKYLKTTPGELLEESIWMAAYVYENSGGANSANFREELLIRQTEIDAIVLRLDDALKQLEKIQAMLPLTLDVIGTHAMVLAKAHAENSAKNNHELLDL